MSTGRKRTAVAIVKPPPLDAAAAHEALADILRAKAEALKASPHFRPLPSSARWAISMTLSTTKAALCQLAWHHREIPDYVCDMGDYSKLWKKETSE
jgi:hypothetical protein